MHLIYENWSQCVATYAFDELNARFIIAEEEPEHSDLYLKVINLDFDSGLF